MSVKSVGEILGEMGMMGECSEYRDLGVLDEKLGDCLPLLVDFEKWEDIEKIQDIRTGIRRMSREIVCKHKDRNGNIPYV